MQKENKCVNIVLLCAITYFVSYITRINYGAIIAEMVTSTGYEKSELSMALTGSFITYGLGQLISGYFGDRYQPRHLVSIGLIASILMNLMIPMCVNKYVMTAVWCVNGFAQSFMWPPIVKLMTSVLSTDEYNRACVKVSWGSSFGTIFVYFAGPAVIALANWQSVFVMCAVMGVAGLVWWNLSCPEIDLGVTVSKKQVNANVDKSSLISPTVIFVMIAIVLQGILRDGVTTWMPSYISETYKLGNEISILTGVLMPLFSVATLHITETVYEKKFKNPYLCATAVFGVGALAGLALYFLSDKSPVSSVLLSAILTGCMHGVNLLLICIVPPLLAKGANVSFVSGLLNCCTYVGSALSAYVIPLAAEGRGWTFTLFIWFIIALAGTLICAVCVRYK